MPFDSPKSTTTHTGNTTASRPLMPALANNRAVKPPLTPSLATQQGNTKISATPGEPRTLTRTDVRVAKSPPASKEELSTPVRAFLDNNVTPRSSSRKSRADSAQSTPGASNNGTPVIPKGTQKSAEDFLGTGASGANSTAQTSSHVGARSGTSSPRRPQSMIVGIGPGHTYALPRPPVSGQSSPMHHGRTESTGFFHANDAKAQSPLLEQRPPLKKGASFFYADGSQEGRNENRNGSPVSNLPSPPLSATGTTVSQFFHADGSVGRLRDSPPSVSPPLPSSISDIQLTSSTTNHMPNLRPASPTKGNFHLSYRKGASQVIRPNSILPPRQTEGESLPARRISVDSNSKRAALHTKGASLSSIDSISAGSSGRTSSPRSSLATSMQQASVAETSPARTSSGSDQRPPTKIQMPPLALDAQAQVTTPGSVVTPLSPTKAAMNPQMAELAANARRERKVMDLEISNSSLLAINRQLEREVRRQKQELRRYRRLTRAGRLSVATAESLDGADVAGFDDELVTDDENDACPSGGLGSLSDEDDDDDDCSESDESAMSPSALAEHDSRKIAKDEKRLRLDLSKHRQLLVDSQKMNQSLRRCLGWTEELISEGKKALSYRVRVSDVKLGGRVLRRDEDYEDGLEKSSVLEESSGAEEKNGEPAAPEPKEEEEEGKDMGDLVGLMSPWMRLGGRSGTATPTRTANGIDIVGLGIQDTDKVDSRP